MAKYNYNKETNKDSASILGSGQFFNYACDTRTDNKDILLIKNLIQENLRNEFFN